MREKKRIETQLKKLLDDEIKFQQNPDEIRKKKIEEAAQILKNTGR
jgi:hypothetical protein